MSMVVEMVVAFAVSFLAGLLSCWVYDRIKRHFQKKDDP